MSAAILLQHVANGQDNTKIISLLAQMPAKDAASFKKNMSAVAALGEDGYVSLISGLSAPGKGNNASIEYAVGALPHMLPNPVMSNCAK
ncbi:hypothetical protein [Mucilaginibacter antarcticus]|uniref:hypothetical protein n=1 Tax=Mucilaginibacter antarcticus TaxID=1855725 RepID=UPI0036275976